MIRDVELAGGVGRLLPDRRPFAGAGGEFHDAPAFRAMDFFLARAGVAARLGVAAGADERDAQRDESVAQRRGFAGREHQSGVGQEEAERADQLHQLAITEMRERLEFTRAGAQARQRDGELRLPALAQQILRVRRDAEGFQPPVRQPIERAETEPAEARRVGALRRFQPPVEVALRPGGVHLGIHGAVVGFLVNDQTFRAGLGDGAIFVRLHRADLERDAGHFVAQRADARGQVAIGDEFRMFARDEQQIAKALFPERAGLAEHFVHRERHAQDRVVAREAAVLAVVDALVGKIERREEPDRFPKIPPRGPCAFPRERLEARIVERIEQRGEAPQGRRELPGLEKMGGGHGGGARCAISRLARGL